MKKLTKNAYTLVEVFLTLTLWSAISALLICTYKGAESYIEKIKLQNVTLEFKNGLNSVITNPFYYAGKNDLGYTNEVKIENLAKGLEDLSETAKGLEDTSEIVNYIPEGGVNYITYKNLDKFRSLLLKELKVPQSDPVSCYIMSEDKKMSFENCYVGTNNVAWGIPDTDFIDKNVVKAKNPKGSVYKYVPVTIYPDIKHLSNIYDFDKYAIVYGVRRDGELTIINTVDCALKEYKKYNQCRCFDVLSESNEVIQNE